MKNITTVLVIFFFSFFCFFSTGVSAENYSEYLDNIQTQSDYDKAWQELIEELLKDQRKATAEYRKKEEEILWKKLREKAPVDYQRVAEEHAAFVKESDALQELYYVKKEVLKTSFEANKAK